MTNNVKQEELIKAAYNILVKYLERSHGRLVSPDIDASQVKYGLVSSEYKFVKSIESVVNQQVVQALEEVKSKGIKDGANVNTVTKMNDTDTQSKQALTSLIKELVEEAKPGRADTQIWRENPDDAWDMAINQFEQNLLKALEEVVR